jgi:hypothetical protein
MVTSFAAGMAVPYPVFPNWRGTFSESSSQVFF